MVDDDIKPGQGDDVARGEKGSLAVGAEADVSVAVNVAKVTPLLLVDAVDAVDVYNGIVHLTLAQLVIGNGVPPGVRLPVIHLRMNIVAAKAISAALADVALFLEPTPDGGQNN